MTTKAVRGCLVAIVAIAVVLLSGNGASGAQRIEGIVVRGVALDRLAKEHSLPPYPLEARSQRIEGDVMVRIEVKGGKMLRVSSESRSLTLADCSSRWIRWHWRFRSEVSGTYYVPITYKLA
jgi:hypothetical protein